MLGVARVAIMRGSGAVAPVSLGNMATYEQLSNADNWPTFNHTLQASDNKIIILMDWQQATETTPAITYGGVAATMIGVATLGSPNIRCAAFHVDDASLPSPGVQAVAVTIDSVGAVSARGHAVVIALQGAEQGTPSGGEIDSDSAGSAQSLTSSVTVSEGGVVLKICVTDDDTTATIAEGSGETVIYEDNEPTSNLTHQSTYKLSQSGVVSMSTSWTGFQNCTQRVVGVSPI